MLVTAANGDQSLSSHHHRITRQRSAVKSCAEPVGAPSAIPPIIINPYSYQTPAPAIDPRVPPAGPPVTPPPRPDQRLG